MGCSRSVPIVPKTQQELEAEKLAIEDNKKKEEKARLAAEEKAREDEKAFIADAELKWPSLQHVVQPFVTGLCNRATSLLPKMAENFKTWYDVQVAQYTDHGPVMGYLVRREFEKWMNLNRFEFRRTRATYVREGYFNYSHYRLVQYGTPHDAAYEIRKIFQVQTAQ